MTQLRPKHYRFLLIFFSCIIVIFSLLSTHRFTETLQEEERKKIEIWAESIKLLTNSDFSTGVDLEFIFRVVESNTTVPSIVVDSSFNLLSYKNIKANKLQTKDLLRKETNKMAKNNKPIKVENTNDGVVFIYYNMSRIQKTLSIFPWILSLIFFIFIGLVLMLVKTSKQSEQNLLWVSMARETAHQLGTPISSVLGWIVLLNEQPDQQYIATELEKDALRLKKISTRFSKIGQTETTEIVDIVAIIENTIRYMQKRTSKRIEIIDKTNSKQIFAKINSTLWEWVIENLLKNAIDAIALDNGKIEVLIEKNRKKLYIDIKDSGKGIPSSKHEKIFEPGFTSKKSGWGIGLSLCRRVVENIYNGKVFVLESELNKGTTIRVLIKTDE
ncbi:MAG: sensor histidine kinase [Bacteroidales bacterium]